MKIMINGRAGAGKDAIADYLVKHFQFRKLAFADGIYNIAYNLFDMEAKDRRLLQRIGQHMRAIDPNVWVKDTFKRAEGHSAVVISDVRQGNEYIMGVNSGFIPLRVEAPLNMRIERCWNRDGVEPDVSLFDNDSETGADNFEYITINNDGSLSELYDKVDDILIQLSTGKLWTPRVG